MNGRTPAEEVIFQAWRRRFLAGDHAPSVAVADACGVTAVRVVDIVLNPNNAEDLTA